MPENEQQEQYVDAVAVFIGEGAKDQQRFNKIAAGENDPRIKALYRELSGTSMTSIIDLAKIFMGTRDEILSYLQDHEERVSQLEEESEGLPVLEEEDKVLFLRCYGESKGAILKLIELADFAKKPHNAAEYETQCKNIDVELLTGVIERLEKMAERITELSTTEEDIEEEGEESTDQQAVAVS